MNFSKLLLYLTLIVFIIQDGISYSQDLIANGSFESYFHCPCQIGDLSVKNWKSISPATPDFHSSCAKKKCPANPKTKNKLFAPSGNSYVRIITHAESQDYREYIGSGLLDSLTRTQHTS